MDRSIFRTGIPAVIVAAVLGFSLLVPAAASRSNSQGDDNNGYGHKCGYGEVQDNDENDNKDQGGGGDRVQTVVSAVKPVAGREPTKFDNDKCEDEDDSGGANGGGGGGDQSVGSTNQATMAPVNPVSKQASIVGVTTTGPKQYVVVSNRPGSDGE